MQIDWPWSKSRTVMCPDGPRLVFKDVSHALPLHIKEFRVAAKATADSAASISGDVALQYEDKVAELLYKIDEFNTSTQSQLRAAYAVYQASPCTHLQFLEIAVERIQNQENALRKADAAVKMVIAAVTAFNNGGLDMEATLSRAAESLALAIDSLRDPPTAPKLLDEMQQIGAKTMAWRA